MAPTTEQAIIEDWLTSPSVLGYHIGISVILLESSSSATIHNPLSLISVEFSI